MRLVTAAVMLLLLAIYMAISVAATIVLNNLVSPHAAYMYMVTSTIITSMISFYISIDIPN
jgi:hypothetical protein